MTSPEVSHTGSRLDAHHLPETNGRMAVCRRCGVHTDTPEGLHHVPREGQLARSDEWLDRQSRQSRIDASMALRKTAKAESLVSAKSP